eukprot:NODE_4510_length_777_cov_26.292308_g4351_i0.p1 GENE.NODE_4510_length_777_cov_26.292308_g4351_i0~~NODE_4510_length_777_cov_26.292308_g4351_i0.p1  ORF type:complete len:248 (-),score=53.08 NODE_4510_length_777_cov_26.292308_g4351_i0:33-719(-)
MQRTLVCLSYRSPQFRPKREKIGERPFLAQYGLLNDARITSYDQRSKHFQRYRKLRYPHIRWAQLHSEALGRKVPLMTTDKSYADVANAGGLDKYLINADAEVLKVSTAARHWREQIVKAKKVNMAMAEVEQQAIELATFIKAEYAAGRPIALTWRTNLGTLAHPAQLRHKKVRSQLVKQGDVGTVVGVKQNPLLVITRSAQEKPTLTIKGSKYASRKHSRGKPVTFG